MAEEEKSRQDFKEEGKEEQPEQQQEKQSADEGVKDPHGQPGINKELHNREVEKLNAQIAELKSQIAAAPERTVER